MPFFDRVQAEIPLTKVKQWLKVEHDLENDLLEELKTLAINEAQNYMQNDFEEVDEQGELVLEPIPFNIILACLMLIAHLYENRGEESEHLPQQVYRLLTPYKKLVGL
jgi:uncharacterized phage protein (predicted DNA packaging)